MRTESIAGRNGDQGGFTLIELLVVIAILGVIAGVVTMSVSGMTDGADESACKAERRTIETALEAYHNEFEAYPAALGDLATSSPEFLKTAPATAKWAFTAHTDEITGAGRCAGY